ncbi:MAG: ATP-binding protein [Defluviitaleaceae bacterium]|nr:ATP-binding protein [Defluviitaleaceae bacterium]
MITLLSSELNYFYLTMNDAQKRKIGLCTRDYIADILKLKEFLNNGLQGAENTNPLNAEKNRHLLTKAKELIGKILNATYSHNYGNERLQLPSGQKIDINLASSGQQESVWITNILFFCILQGKKSAFIIEEPESNLYPETQKLIIDLIALTANQGNNIIITTHSPYILGSINNLLYAGQFSKQNTETATKASKIIDKDFWIDGADLSAWHVKNGTVTNCIDDEIGLIQDELIDEISGVINKQYADLLNIEED